ncbi:MAG TPA: DNA gyrase subunit A [Acidimicrobiales bacterium]|nr:DNA gyrase subunit A [Acidimicrobiales bacterium]
MSEQTPPNDEPTGVEPPTSPELTEVDPADVDPTVDRIQPVDLQLEMQRSYLDYAMSVIVGRALPDVRDGLKPVHNRVLYAMYDGGYRPDRQFSKCSRVVGDVMGKYHPHGDVAIYDALVRLVQDWTMRYPLVQGQGNFGSPGNDPAAAPRYTECRMAPLAMEMVRDIDEDTVDFRDNYDGRTKEPVVLPARFPNLLVNGSAGIAVGMATNIPPHNLREVASGVQWYLENPEATKEELLEALIARIPGPDFPTGATILGRRGIEEAYRTGRGSITMRAVVTVEEIQNRTCLVVSELPYQVNPDNLASKIADLVKEGRVQGIADIRDETSGRTGQRLVVVLKRDAVAKVVLNNLYKHTQLQDTFGANMLALVEGVPRTLSIDAFVRHWVNHQLDVIQRRTRFRLRQAEERAHVLRGYLKALDALDEVIALIRASATVEDAREGLMALLEVDEIQARAILNLQLRQLAALERQKILDEYEQLMAKIADYNDILAKPERQREIVGTELGEIVDKYGDDRRTQILPYDGEVSMEDLIAEEEVVVTITRSGYVKRTRSDQYRVQKRGGKGVRGAQLRADDVVEHFGVTTTHHWLLFFTNLGRVYRAKGYELPEGGRDSKGQHVANLLAFQPGEQIAKVIDLRDYEQAEYLVLATRRGHVKKTRLAEYDSPRSGGLIAINLREDDGGVADEVVSAALVDDGDELLLVSRLGQAVRFRADADQLRPMGRATAGVTGMKFEGDDELLAMDVVREGSHLVTVTDGGYAKRSDMHRVNAQGHLDYRRTNRGTKGVRAVRLPDGRGNLVGAKMVERGDEVLVVMESGKVVRSSVDEIPVYGRDSAGVILAKPDAGDRILAVARNVERNLGGEEGVENSGENGDENGSGTGSAPAPTADAATVDPAAGTPADLDEDADLDEGADEQGTAESTSAESTPTEGDR